MRSREKPSCKEAGENKHEKGLSFAKPKAILFNTDPRREVISDRKSGVSLQPAFQLSVAVGAGIAPADFFYDAFQTDRTDIADFYADVAVLSVGAQVGLLFRFLRFLTGTPKSRSISI